MTDTLTPMFDDEHLDGDHDAETDGQRARLMGAPSVVPLAFEDNRMAWLRGYWGADSGSDD